MEDKDYVVAIRPGFFEGRMILEKEKFYVPKGLKGKWFVPAKSESPPKPKADKTDPEKEDDSEDFM